MLVCEKTVQQNLCEKGGVPEAQPILGYGICKKGKYEPLQNVDRNLCKQWCVFFKCYGTPLKRMYGCEKGWFHSMCT